VEAAPVAALVGKACNSAESFAARDTGSTPGPPISAHPYGAEYVPLLDAVILGVIAFDNEHLATGRCHDCSAVGWKLRTTPRRKKSEEENKSSSMNLGEEHGPKKTITFTPPFSDHFPAALGTSLLN